MRFAPVEGRIDGGKTALVAISPDRPVGAEVDELRARAGDLESLAAAGRGALPAATGRDEVRRHRMRGRRRRRGSRLAALLEPHPDGTGLVVSASHGFELERPGRSALDGPSIAGPGLQHRRALVLRRPRAASG